MAKKFAHIKSISDVFNYEDIDSKKVYNLSDSKHSDINKNTLCFVQIDEDSSDIGGYIDGYEIKAKDRYIICQGSIFAYVGGQCSPTNPDDPENPEEYIWRPIFINNNLIEDLEFDTYNGITNPEKDYNLNFTTNQTNLDEDTFNILDIKTEYDLDTNTVSALFDINGVELKSFIEKVLPPSQQDPGNGYLYIKSNGDNVTNFSANQEGDTSINFISGNNIELSIEENNSIKISASIPEIDIPDAPEEPNDGVLLFTFENEHDETGENTLGRFSANQGTNTNIKFLAGDNIRLEGENGLLKITGTEQKIYTTANIKFAKEINIGGTKLGDIIAEENIFPDDKITTDMTLQEVFEAILHGTATMEKWGEQVVLAELIPSNNTKIKLTAHIYYSNGEIGEEIDLNQSIISIEAGTMILVTYKTEDPVVYQNVTVGPFIGGFALDNTSIQAIPTEEQTEEQNQYIEYKGYKEYKKTFDGASFEFNKHTTDWTGFSKENVTGINENQIVLKVAKGENDFYVNQGWYIKPNLMFDQYNVYPISNRGTIGTTEGLYKIIDYKLFAELPNTGTLTSLLHINGIDKELLPYYLGYVNNYDNIFDFVEGQEISSETLVNNTENGIRIDRYDVEAPKIIEPTTYTDDLQLFIAVPANQFSSTNWLVSVVNTAAFNDDVTNIDDEWFKSEKLSLLIDGKPYYLWCIEGKDEYSVFESNTYKITLNK